MTSRRRTKKRKKGCARAVKYISIEEKKRYKTKRNR